MPLLLLDTLTSVRVVPEHAIAGARTVTVVSHVGLVAARSWVSAPCDVQVCHMGPPLRRDHAMSAHVVAWRDDLTSDEARDIGDWVASVDVTVRYIAFPSVGFGHSQRDIVTGRPIATAFSCAGFVAQAYREAGVTLVVDDPQLPPASRTLLETVWGPRQVRAGARYGLEGAGPWPVLLPGYVLHAASAPRASLPFAPTLAHASVP